MSRRTSQSSADTDDPKALSDARRLLFQLMPVARGRFKELSLAGTPSPLMASMATYATAANMLGVFIYETDDGWYADLVFRRVPMGLPGVVGNPSANPYKTRREAVDGATSTIAVCLAMEEKTVTIPESNPEMRAFQIDDVWVELPIKVIEQAGRIGAALGMTAERARERLGEMTEEDFGAAAITAAGLETLPPERWSAYLSYVAVLLSNGHLRYVRKEPPVVFYDEKTAQIKNRKEEPC